MAETIAKLADRVLMNPRLLFGQPLRPRTRPPAQRGKVKPGKNSVVFFMPNYLILRQCHELQSVPKRLNLVPFWSDHLLFLLFLYCSSTHDCHLYSYDWLSKVCAN